MSYDFYKVLHFVGIFIVFSALGGQIFHFINGGLKEHPSRRFIGIGHGVGLLLMLVGGFGLLARMGIVNGLPGWVIAKIVLWVLLGALAALVIRMRNWARPLWFVLIIIGACAAYLARVKPF